MEQWKEYRLGEVVNILDNKRVPLSSKERSNRKGSFPYYGAQGIIDYIDDYIFDGTYLLVAEDGENLKSHKQQISQIAKGKYWVNNHAHILESNGKCDIRYICYLLNTIDISGYVTGSAQPKLNQENLKAITLKLPSLATQIRIADFISMFDDKIALNRKINSNLEEQAKALFKSWFIDFEPFKGGKFDDSELGKIPEGWEVRRLDEVSKIVGGGTPSKSKPQYFSHNGIHWITPKDLSLSHAKFTSSGADDITIEGYNNSSARLMPKGTVLFSSRAPIGYISIALNELCTNQGFKSVVPQELNTIYLYYYIKFHVKDIEAKASGSTFKEVSGSLMKSIPIIVPSANAVDKFENVLTPIFNYQAHIEKENSQLSSLRDTLLPKLMSGEIDVEHSKLLFI